MSICILVSDTPATRPETDKAHLLIQIILLHGFNVCISIVRLNRYVIKQSAFSRRNKVFNINIKSPFSTLDHFVKLIFCYPNRETTEQNRAETNISINVPLIIG